MEWTTHMLSGMVAGYMVTGGDWKGAVAGGIAGIVPDLDEPKSVFGKVFFPVSILLNQVFGHRTFTHSLLFVVLTGGVFSLLAGPFMGLAIMAGITAHILGDMLTGKVQILYPIKKSVGIPVSSFMFMMNDRICKYVMLCLLIVFGWNDLADYL